MNRPLYSLLNLCIVTICSFGLYLLLFGVYDELHIKSTDYQLQDNLTLTRVIVDTVLVAISALTLVSVVCIGVYALNRVKTVPRSGFSTALATGLWLATIIVYLSVAHYAETHHKLNSELQWRLTQQKSAVAKK